MKSKEVIVIKEQFSKRKSNFELIRIVAMFFIVSYHLINHGIIHNPAFENGLDIWNQGEMINQLFSSFLQIGGGFGVALYAMLTGYFLIYSDKINLKKIICETFYYGILTVVAFGIAYALGYRFIELGSTTELLKFMLKYFMQPVSSGVWWFISAYVFLVLLHPLINGLFLRVNEKGYILLLAFIWLVWYSFGDLLDTTYYGMLKLLLFYLIGGYVRKFDIVEKAKSKRVVLRIILIACFALFTITTWLGYKQGTPNMLNGILLARVIRLFNTPVIVPLSALIVFLLIGGRNIRTDCMINIIASTTFGIYLLHDSVFIRIILWNEILNVKDLYLSRCFIPLAIGSICLVFMICSLLDLFRLRFIEPKMLKILSELEVWFQNKCLLQSGEERIL